MFKYILLIMLLQLSHVFLSFIPLCSVPLLPSSNSPPQFMSLGHTCKFFGFSISYTILNLPLTILYLPIMLLIPCTFFPILPALCLLPTDNLNVISIFVILFLFQLFAWFVFCFLGSVVDSCGFVVILLFIFLIIFFLDKPL